MFLKKEMHNYEGISCLLKLWTATTLEKHSFFYKIQENLSRKFDFYG